MDRAEKTMVMIYVWWANSSSIWYPTNTETKTVAATCNPAR